MSDIAGTAATEGSSAVGSPAAAPAALPRQPEPIEQKYLRETRNAAVFIAVVVGIMAALSLVAVILVGVQLNKVSTQLNNLDGGSTTSNCMSQGGTDPTC